MTKRLSIVKSCLIGAVPVVVLLAAAPVRPALAQFGSLFSAVTDTENAIGGLLQGVVQCVNEMNTLRQTTLAPLAELIRIQSGISGTVNSYRGWMSSVFGTSIASGQTPGVLNFESSLLQGSSMGGGFAGGGLSVNVASPFATIYGAIPTAMQANSVRSQQIDMTDALAKDAMTQGTYADASANSAITLAHTLEDQAAGISSGSAPLIEAQALAATLQSVAVEHKIYAAQLRTMSAQLAAQGAAIKERANTSLATTNGLSLLMQRRF